MNQHTDALTFGGRIVPVNSEDLSRPGTTALEADNSAALHQVNPERLYVTAEAIQPGGGSPSKRDPTIRDRVEAQLDATAPYVRGATGFQWADLNSRLHIDHIGDGACAAGPNHVE